MPDVFQTFFSYRQFIPHGHCYLWKPDLVWLHLVSDGITALAYYSIPVLLIVLIRKRRDLPFHSIFWLFGAFIIACGTTHVMDIVTLWYPIYWVSGVIKAITAGVSIFTALELAPLIPKVLTLPSPAQLEAANQELKQQVQERERAEANLREQESTLRSFYNSSPMMMGVVELLENDILHCSDNLATANLFNTTPEAIKNQRASAMGTPQEYIRIWLTHYHESAQTGSPIKFEYCHAHSEGDRWFSATVCPIRQDAEGQNASRFAYVVEDITDRKQAEAALQALNQDLEQRVQQRTAELQSTNEILLKEITERKRAETELKESQQRLEMAMNAAHMGMWDYNLASGEVSASDPCKRMFGYSIDQDLSYDRVHDRIVDDDRKQVQQAIAQSIKTGSDYNIEYRVKWLDGSIHWIAALGRAFQGKHHQHTRLLGVALDVTERKQSEEALKRQAQALEEANRLKDDFLAIVSHELRTPLNSILGWASLLRSRKFEQAKVEQALETIERNAKAQTQLIEDLLDISRLMRGKLRLNRRPIDLNSMLENSLNAMRPTAEAKQIQLIKYMTTLAPVMVDGDLERLQQVMWNLLTNAIKFTPTGGRVEVELDMVSSTPRNGSTPDSMARITVRDTGKGIPVDFLPYVFERFRQADSSITREQGGLGLGLAIVRQLVELHGGNVSVTSPGEGKGSTFIIQLPLLLTEDQSLVPLPLNPIPMSANYSLHGLKILVVDDEPDARLLMTTILRQSNAIVHAVDSVDKALAQVNEFQPDLLISDIGMPGGDGYSLIRKIRVDYDRTQKHLPAIALTAYASSSDRAAAIAAGFDQHVTKPADPVELITIAAQLCGRL
jgi:PAS domain S-box-containing protein